MTQRLYYDNAYLTEFDAQVLACRENGERFDVLLDQSAFYPTSGGQPFDTGTLGGVQVVDVNVADGDVWHTVMHPLTVGERVHGAIDWTRRFDHMQQHAADHMIAGTLHRLIGGVTIGLHISDDVSTIDVAMPDGVMRISADDVHRIELEVNERIQRDVPIRCWFPTDDELNVLPLRKKPTVSEHVRVVAIGDDEMVACGGTHPSSAGQLGVVKILSATPARGKMRVAFIAGRRALADYQRVSDAAHAVGTLLSAGTESLASAVEALQVRLHDAEHELVRFKREQLLSQAQRFAAEAETLPDGTKLISRLLDADAASLRDLASSLIEQPGRIVLLGAVQGEQVLYVFGRSADVKADMGKLLREAAREAGGKGGGRPDFAQGSGSAELLAAAVRVLNGASFEK